MLPRESLGVWRVCAESLRYMSLLSPVKKCRVASLHGYYLIVLPSWIDRYEEEGADGTDSTVYSTAVALAIMGCFQVR